jgi:hypothetical protein
VGEVSKRMRRWFNMAAVTPTPQPKVPNAHRHNGPTQMPSNVECGTVEEVFQRMRRWFNTAVVTIALQSNGPHNNERTPNYSNVEFPVVDVVSQRTRLSFNTAIVTTSLWSEVLSRRNRCLNAESQPVDAASILISNWSSILQLIIRSRSR